MYVASFTPAWPPNVTICRPEHRGRAYAERKMGPGGHIMATVVKKRTLSRSELAKAHAGHAQHLCELVAKRRMDQVAQLSAGAKYVCYICGRAAAKAVNLCEPVEI